MPSTTTRTPRRKAPTKTAPARRGAAHTPLADEAYSRLEELIVTLKLKPGLSVSEGQLSEQLGIGRTPIREALQRLAAQKLIKVLPQRGIIVSEIDVKAQLRLLEVRRELERLVVRCAARRANEEERVRFNEIHQAFEASAQADDAELFMRHDREFNDLSIVAARNEFAAGSMNLINSLSRRFWYLHYQQAADLPLTARLHAGVAKSIAAGDEEGAATASDLLLDAIERFTRATVSTDF